MTGCDYYDSEIIAAVARNMGDFPGLYGRHAVQSRVAEYFSYLSRNAFLGLLCLLLAGSASGGAEKVVEQIASLSKDCIIVGRNADMLLRDHAPFNIFVCARTEAKIKRYRTRASAAEKPTEKELIRKMKQIDKGRSQTRELMGGPGRGGGTATI